MPKPALSSTHASRLHAIADMLGKPVETFYANPGSDGEADVCALIRHWTAVEDIQARRRILSFVKQEARRAGYVEDA